MDDSGNYTGYPSGGQGLGLIGAITKGLQGYMQGRQMAYQRMIAQTQALRQQQLADSLINRRSDQTTQTGETIGLRASGLDARYNPTSPYNTMKQGDIASTQDDKEDAADRATAQAILDHASTMAAAGLDPGAINGYVQQSIGLLRPRARSYFLGQAGGQGGAGGAATPDAPPPGVIGPPPSAASSLPPPLMGGPAGAPAPTPTQGVAPPPGAPMVPMVPTTGPPPVSAGGTGGMPPVIGPPPGAGPGMPTMGAGVAPMSTPAGSGGSGLPFYLQTNRAALQKQAQPVIAEYRAWINSPDTAKLPAPIQEGIASGYRAQITGMGLDPDQLGVVSPVQAGKSSLIAPPPPMDPQAKALHDDRTDELGKLWDKLNNPAFANDANRPKDIARANVLRSALMPGAPPLTFGKPGLTPEQIAQNALEKQRNAQTAAAQASEQEYRKRSLALETEMHDWTMSGGNANPVNWSVGQMMDKRAELHKTGAPTLSAGPNNTLVNIPGPALVDSPQGKAADAFLNSLIYAKSHGMPLPKPPSGAVMGAPGMSGDLTGFPSFDSGAPSTPRSIINPPPSKPKKTAAPTPQKRTVPGTDLSYSYTVK